MIKYYYNLVYCLPFAIISGPFLTNLIVIICSILFLIDTFKYKLFDYYNNHFFKIFIAFFVLINISSVFSDNLNSFKYTISYLRFGIFSIFIFYILKNIENFKLNFSYFIIGIIIIIFFDSLIQIMLGKNIFGYDLNVYKTGLPYITSFFDDDKKLGSFIVRIFPLIIFSVLIIHQSAKNSNFLKYSTILIPLILIIVILTTERVAIYMLSIFIILIFIKSEFFFKPKKIYFLITVALVVLLLILNPLLYEKIKSVFYSMGIISPGLNNVGEISGGYENKFYIYSKFYQDQLLISLNTLRDNLFFGIGAKNYKFLSTSLNAGTIGWHPHNFHAQILAELGIFTYLLFVSIFFYLLFLTFKFFFKNKITIQEEMKFFIILYFVVSLLPIPSGDFFNSWLNTLLYFPVGFYLFLNEKKL